MQEDVHQLSELRELSAQVGADEMLVQAGGGNASLKTASGLWIKASGTRLADAQCGDIFLLIPWEQVRAWSVGDGEVLNGRTPGGRDVRASVEAAMHIAMPHRLVVHIHSVRALHWLVCPERNEELEQRLSGLSWARLPYVHPGRRLADAIGNSRSGPDLDILLLENHGVVIGADDATHLLRLLSEVERRLESPTRPMPCSRVRLEEGALPSWHQQQDDVGCLASDPDALRIAAGGTLYPDHCVYLGPSVAVANDLNSVGDSLAAYEARYGFPAKALFLREVGAFLREPAREEARAMLRCLVQIVSRIEVGAKVQYLPLHEVNSLMHWDAEHYRRSIAAGSITGQ